MPYTTEVRYTRHPTCTNDSARCVHCIGTGLSLPTCFTHHWRARADLQLGHDRESWIKGPHWQRIKYEQHLTRTSLVQHTYSTCPYQGLRRRPRHGRTLPDWPSSRQKTATDRVAQSREYAPHEDAEPGRAQKRVVLIATASATQRITGSEWFPSGAKQSAKFTRTQTRISNCECAGAWIETELRHLDHVNECVGKAPQDVHRALAARQDHRQRRMLTRTGSKTSLPGTVWRCQDHHALYCIEYSCAESCESH